MEKETKELAVRPQTNLPAFAEDAMQTFEKAQEYAQLILDSKLAPDHFYDSRPDGKPDFNKGNKAAVLMVVQKGHVLDIDPMHALQSVVPINGLLTIKGDLAKALIMRSGVLEKGSWKEVREGSIEDDTLRISISAKRRDTGEEATRSFSVEKAKRAGLWIDEASVAKEPKKKYSPWYRYQERMVYYRALGFLARDLFSDIIAGMYISEEARDIPQEEFIDLQTKGGETIQVSTRAQEANKERSDNLVGGLQKKRQRIGDRAEDVQEVKEEAFKEEPAEKREKEDAKFMPLEVVNEDILSSMGKDIYKYAEKVLPKEKQEELDNLPGNKSQKKWRDFLLKYRDQKLADNINTDPYDYLKVGASEATELFDDSKESHDANDEEAGNDKQRGEEDGETSEDDQPEFSEIPESGSRSFAQSREVYEHFLEKYGKSMAQMNELLESLELSKKYEDFEEFTFTAPLDDIGIVLEKLNG